MLCPEVFKYLHFNTRSRQPELKIYQNSALSFSNSSIKEAIAKAIIQAGGSYRIQPTDNNESASNHLL